MASRTQQGATAGLLAGSVVGGIRALGSAAVLLARKEAVVADLEAALAAQGVPGPGGEALFWMSLVVGSLFILAMDAVVGTGLGALLARLERTDWPSVLVASVLVGLLSGLITNLPLARELVLAGSALAWVGFALVFRRSGGVTGGETRQQATAAGAGAGGEDGTRLERQPRVAIDWQLFGVLTGAGLVGIIGLIAVQVLTGTLVVDDPLVAVQVVLSVGVNGALVAAAVLAGLVAGPRRGLGAPKIAAWLDGRRPAGRPLLVAAGLGALAGVLIIGLDLAVFLPYVRAAVLDPGGAAGSAPPWWSGLLLTLYGGITEELLLRLGLLTLLVAILARVTGAEGQPAAWAMWVAILVTAVLFGLGHLPATAAALELTPAIVVRAVVLNGVGGVVFGWLYWRRGLLDAIAAHAAADVVLHVLFPLVTSL